MRVVLSKRMQQMHSINLENAKRRTKRKSTLLGGPEPVKPFAALETMGLTSEKNADKS